MDHHVVTILPGGRITIPAAIRRSLDLQPGDALVWYMQGRELHFRKAKSHEITHHSEYEGHETADPSVNDHQSAEG